MSDPLETFLSLFIEGCTKEQLFPLLQAVTNAYEYGQCPLCGYAEVPTDKRGHKMREGSTAVPYGYREEHDEPCPVWRIEKSFTRKRAERES